MAKEYKNIAVTPDTHRSIKVFAARKRMEIAELMVEVWSVYRNYQKKYLTKDDV